MIHRKKMRTRDYFLISAFLLAWFPFSIYGNNCPPPEHIMPCRCRGRNDQIQVWCSHSDLERVNGALENLMRLRSMPAIDELIVENNRMPTLPARAFGALQIGRLLLRNNGLESISRNAFAGLEDSIEELYIVEDKLVDFPFDSIENLRNLEAFTVEKSRIRLLPRFSGLNRLKHIRIDGSLITGFPVGAFSAMASVKQIHVVNSNVANLAEGIFGPLDTLILANFSGNRIDFIQRRSFALLPKLEVLSLTHNNLHDAVAVGRACEELTSLKSLDLSNNKFKSLPEGSFVNLRSLQMLNLASNKVHNVSPRSFSHLPALRKVDLSYNELRNFPPLFFDSAPLLEELRMRSNLLGTANEIGEMLGALKSLRFLDLGENGLIELPTGAIRDHTHLQRLDLSDNKIKRIQRNAFRNVPSLMEMSLRNNSIEEIPSDGEAWDIASLKELDISANNLQQLHTQALKGLPRLARMDISHNSIKNIGPNTFMYNKDMELLDMNANSINFLAPEALIGLSKLNKLDISRNLLENIQPGAFRDLKSLQTLNLANNRLNNLPPNILHELRALEELNLKSNSLSHIPQGIFTNLENLKELNLKHNTISNVNSLMLDGLKNLESLKLASNQINHFDESAFDNLLKLRSIDLSSNRINKLSSRSFKNLPTLEKFEARENRINNFEQGAFANSEQLQILDLAHNALDMVPALVKSNPALKVIDLSHNQIANVDAEMLKQSNSLMELYLNDNKIKGVTSRTFNNMNSLTILDMDGNEMEELQPETFRNLPRLIYLRMSRNRIRNIRSAAFSDLNSLDGLDLQENELETISESAFDRTGALKYLNLSHNNFDSMSRMGLTPLQSLEVLDTSYNRLREVDEKALRHLQWLVELRMNDNGICRLPAGIFDGMSRLKMLVMKNNFISHLYETVFYKLRNNIAFLDISGNPLSCDCELTWLRNLMARDAVQELSESVCESPNELKGSLVKQVRPGRMVCANNNRGSHSSYVNEDKCPVLKASRRKPRPSPDALPSEQRPLFGNTGASGSSGIFTDPADSAINNDIKNRRKDEKLIESNDYIPGDTPTIYAGSSQTGTKATQQDVVKKSSSNSVFGGLGSLFGIPLDFGLNLGISPSFIIANKEKPNQENDRGIKGPDPLPPSWVERPSKADYGKPAGSVYEPPEYIPRKPTQPYIPLNPYANTGPQSNVVPSGTADIHKTVPATTDRGIPQRRPGIKFPSTGPSSGDVSHNNHPASWHPSYPPNTETGFIPIEPFFHSVSGNEIKRNETKHPDKIPGASINYYDTTGRPSYNNKINSESPKPTNAPAYATNNHGFELYKPEASATAPPPTSASQSEEYEDEESFTPENVQSTSDETPTGQSANNPNNEDFLSDFWSMFSGNGTSGKPRPNDNEVNTDRVAPVDFSSPVDTSTVSPQTYSTGPAPTVGTPFLGESQQQIPQSEHTFEASSQFAHGAHRRPTVTGKPTITKILMEETTHAPPYRTNYNTIPPETTDHQNLHQSQQQLGTPEGLAEGVELSTVNPLIPPVVIGNSEAPLDWYYTNYNNHNNEREELEKFLERSKLNQFQNEIVDLREVNNSSGSIARCLSPIILLVLPVFLLT